MKKTIKDIDVKNKKVLMRVDFNVPLTPEGKVSDDTRIVKALPTIKYLKEQRAKIILMSHLGKPKGKVVEELRLEPVARYLSTLLNESVLMLSDCIGEEVEIKVDGMLEGDIVLLENLRFHAEEENNDPEFAKKLVSLADVYVNDAFGTAHRAHASTEGVTKFIPAVAGLLMEEEINNLSNILEKPEHPLVCLVGGAKISTKIKVIEKLLERAEKVLLGGALVNNILIEKGQNIGKSKVEKEMAFEAKKLLPYLEEGENKLYMPLDYIVASSPNENAKSRISNGTDLKDFEMILDIGPKTIAQYKEIINNSNMVIWNGPMGLFEIPKFAKGSYEIAQAVADSNAKSIIGGGETLDLVKSLGLEEKLTFVSTGGGAMLEFLEGKELPGIVALNDK